MKCRNLNQMIMHKVIIVSGLGLCYLAGCAQRTATLTDSRDGKTYKTVSIGTQIWMAENLNYEMPESWYYDDNPENGPTYGRLYAWEAAKTACPECWHLPSEEEWNLYRQDGTVVLYGTTAKAQCWTLSRKEDHNV